MPEREDATKNILKKWRIKALLFMRLAIARLRLSRRKGGDVSHIGVEQLRLSPLFASWPVVALSRLRQQMVCEVYRVGDAIVYGNEPNRASSLYWVVSGRLAEVLSKHDNLRMLKANAEPEGHPVTSTVTSGDSSEALMGSLETFRPGRLAAGERLFLGTCYRRTIRCQTDVTVLRVPYSAVKLVIQAWNIPLSSTLSEAKNLIREQMEWSNEKPSIQTVVHVNPILSGLDTSTLNVLWLRLSPIVMCASEIITPNIFSSDTVYFLHTGCVKIVSDDSNVSKIITASATAIGLNNFACVEVPKIFNEVQHAVAVSFTQLWSVSVSTLQQVVCEDEKRRCFEIARRCLRLKSSRTMIHEALRKVWALSTFPESTILLIAQQLQVSVVGSGDCLLVAAKVPHEAFIVLTGRTFRSKNACKARDDTVDDAIIRDEKGSIQCGEPIAFNECITQRVLNDGVFTLTSSIVLSITRDSIIKALHKTDDFSRIHRLCEEEAECVEGGDGVRRTHIPMPIKTRTYAMHRVRVAEDEKRKVILTAPFQADESRLLAKRLALCNRVLSSLTVQLRVPPSKVTESWRSGLLRDVAVGCIGHAAQPITMRRGPYRSSSCFTLDLNGEISFCEEGKKGQTQPSTRVDPTSVECVSLLPPSPRAAQRSLKPPLPSALWCSPADTTGRSFPVTVRELSHQVKEMQHEAKKLQDEVEDVLALPLVVSPRDWWILPERRKRM